MENVVAFNNELSGLYESKPPISKAKMAAITRAAMRAIKFYKHVVQSVEKFILKCKPEYKVPGLYVIDSIVRQSRHQYGPEKDVFAPRFARNMKETFANLFRCAPEDKSRIIRVLNLWQKNNVFAPDVIQPIFDLADPNHPIYSIPPPGTTVTTTGPSGSTNLGVADISASQANGGLNTSSGPMDISMGGSVVVPQVEDKLPQAGLADLSNNNLKQLLNDPNVLRQLQTLQNFTKFKQDDKQHNLRIQGEAFEKHLQNVLKSSTPGSGNQDANDFNKEVEFISEEQKIEVINLDGNDSRSPTPDRDRYKRRRSRSRSRSRDRGGRNRRRSRSRSRSRSPRSNRRRTSRDRERSNRDKERDREHERERRKKGLPDIKKDHLSVCSTTLWVGHLSKLVYQEELSDTFGEYGDIVSIDQIVPRGCAFIVMNRRQDAYKAMQGLKNHKMQGRIITISWAAGKGVKSKEWKDFWDLELGVTYIPWSKLDENTDFDSLEEGGMFDEDSMPVWMKEKITKIKSLEEITNEHSNLGVGMSGPPPALPPSSNSNMMFGIDTTQPPPGPPPTGGPPPIMPMVPGQFSMAPPMGGPPRMLGPPHMGMTISGLHMPPNIMPPHAMMMMPGFGMGGPPPMGPPHLPPMGGPHGSHPTQFPPPPGGPPPSVMAPNINLSSDDQMDIEMEDEDGTGLAAPAPISVGGGNNMNFSQPPPTFGSGENSAPGTSEGFLRDRNRGAASSRWGGRGAGPDDDTNECRWRENGGGPPQSGPPHSFQDGGSRNSGGPLHRSDFMNDYDKRGPGPRGGPNFNGSGGDFQPNVQNRFNQPTNLMQMRIPPPNPFNQRGGPGGGPPMFMRGGPGGIGRQQGPGFFNRNNPFDRDPNDGFGGRGRGRGGIRGGRGSRIGGYSGRDAIGGAHGGNWSDEEVDDGGFKRRGGGNHFRDREDCGDHFNMRENNNRGGRRSLSGPLRERTDVDRENRERDNRSGRGQPAGINSGRYISRDDNKKKSRISDTEEDWDRELEDYDGRGENRQLQLEAQSEESTKVSLTKPANNSSSAVKSEENLISQETDKSITLLSGDELAEKNEIKDIKTTAAIRDDNDKSTKSTTSIYDELPTPKANVYSKPVQQPAIANEIQFETTALKEAKDFKSPPAETKNIEQPTNYGTSNTIKCPSTPDITTRAEQTINESFTQNNSETIEGGRITENRPEEDATPNVPYIADAKA